MPYPDKPNIQTSYTAYEQSLGDGSLPGQELDNDFANLADSVESLNDFVRGITRSDGNLANGLVTQESLAASVRIGIDPPTTWATATAYAVGRSTVFSGFGFYVCAASHTSGASFAADNGAGRWTLLADLTPPTGTLLRDQNLSDVANAATARANLGVSLGNLGVNASAAELNILDGATVSTGELNNVTGSTAFGTSMLRAANAAAGLNLLVASNPIRMGVNGTAAAPAYSFAADPDTGFIRSAPDALQVVAGGAAVAQFQSGGLTLFNPLTISNGGTGGVTDAAARDNLTVPARPTALVGVGQWATIAPAFGAAYSVPAGGEWAFVAFVIDSSGRMIDVQVFTGVVPGGTPIWIGVATVRIVGFAWRFR